MIQAGDIVTLVGDRWPGRLWKVNFIFPSRLTHSVIPILDCLIECLEDHWNHDQITVHLSQIKRAEASIAI